MRRSLPLALSGLVLVPALLWAGTVTIPNAFVDGNVASAAAVNANFTAVSAAINDNAARVAGLEARGPKTFECNPADWNAGANGGYPNPNTVCTTTVTTTGNALIEATLVAHINATAGNRCTAAIVIDGDLTPGDTCCNAATHARFAPILSHHAQWVPASTTRYKEVGPGNHTVSFFVASNDTNACQFNGSSLRGVVFPR